VDQRQLGTDHGRSDYVDQCQLGTDHGRSDYADQCQLETDHGRRDYADQCQLEIHLENELGGGWLSVLENESLEDNNGILRDGLTENPNSHCDSSSHYKNLDVVACDHPSGSVRVGNTLMGMKSKENANAAETGVTSFCFSCFYGARALSVPAQRCASEVLPMVLHSREA
jgi:hypothetical protein